MGFVDALGDSHLIFEEKPDIIHFRQDVENPDDEGPPSRPISRLGFNRPALSAGSPERHEIQNSEAIQWSRSLFQSIGVSELRLSDLKTHSGNASVKDTLSPAHTTSDIGESSIPTREEYFESPYGNAVEDMVKYTKVDRKSPSTSPPSVSRLSFPFVTTPSPRRNKTPPSPRPPQRHKYSCFPSLMSPEPVVHASPSHQRHSYRQHGYSRLALENLKWFWSVREHEWQTCNTDLSTVNPYGASPDEPHVKPAVIHPSNWIPTTYAHSRQTLPPLTIHPRRGDIAALRDPYSFHIDRCFAGLSNWTIGKILWMLDVHAAKEKRKMDADIEQDTSDEENESESELETSASTGYSDDSDCTLVESENESDLIYLRKTILDSSIPMINNDDDAAESSQALSVGYLDKACWFQSVYTQIPRSEKSDGKNIPWPTNWYHRWALLVDISRRDKDRKHLLFDSAVPPIEFIPIKDDTGPHFILVGKHKYLANDELCNSKLGNSDT